MTKDEREYIEATVEFYKKVSKEYEKYEKGTLHELHLQYKCVSDVLNSLLKHLDEMNIKY